MHGVLLCTCVLELQAYPTASSSFTPNPVRSPRCHLLHRRPLCAPVHPRTPYTHPPVPCHAHWPQLPTPPPPPTAFLPRRTPSRTCLRTWTRSLFPRHVRCAPGRYWEVPPPRRCTPLSRPRGHPPPPPPPLLPLCPLTGATLCSIPMLERCLSPSSHRAKRWRSLCWVQVLAVDQVIRTLSPHTRTLLDERCAPFPRMSHATTQHHNTRLP
jgi:hypothetical protein